MTKHFERQHPGLKVCYTIQSRKTTQSSISPSFPYKPRRISRYPSPKRRQPQSLKPLRSPSVSISLPGSPPLVNLYGLDLEEPVSFEPPRKVVRSQSPFTQAAPSLPAVPALPAGSLHVNVGVVSDDVPPVSSTVPSVSEGILFASVPLEIAALPAESAPVPLVESVNSVIPTTVSPTSCLLASLGVDFPLISPFKNTLLEVASDPASVATCPPASVASAPASVASDPASVATCPPASVVSAPASVASDPASVATCPPASVASDRTSVAICPPASVASDPASVATCPPASVASDPASVATCPPASVASDPTSVATCPSASVATCPPASVVTCPPSADYVLRPCQSSDLGKSACDLALDPRLFFAGAPSGLENSFVSKMLQKANKEARRSGGRSLEWIPSSACCVTKVEELRFPDGRTYRLRSTICPDPQYSFSMESATQTQESDVPPTPVTKQDASTQVTAKQTFTPARSFI